MSRYDTTFIVNPQIGDDNINASVNAITEIITSNEGEVLRERRIGSRRLAYQIDRQTHGYYVSLIHDCDASVLPKLDRHFKLGDNYLRDLTIRYDGDPFRKSITDVMMGADSDDRRPAGNRDSGDGRRPATASATPAAKVESKVEAKPAASPEAKVESKVEAKPATSPEAKVESKAEATPAAVAPTAEPKAEDTPVADAPSSAITEEEAL